MTRILFAALLCLAPLAAYADDAKAPQAAAKPNIDPEAKKVIEKAIDAVGGAAALEKYPASNAKIKGEMTAFGLDIPFEGDLVAQRPDKARLAMTATVQGTKIEVVQVVNGNKVKTTGGNENPSAAEKEELRQVPVLAEVSALTPLLKGDKFTVKAEKDEVVGDAPASVILVTAKGLNDVRLFFDKKTGLPIKTVRKSISPAAAPGAEATKVTEEMILSDYKEVQGIKSPFKTVVTHDGKKFMTMTVTELKYMEKADAKAFAIDD